MWSFDLFIHPPLGLQLRTGAANGWTGDVCFWGRFVGGSKLDASGRPLKARLLSALDIANGMIEVHGAKWWLRCEIPLNPLGLPRVQASKSSVAAERALALSVKRCGLQIVESLRGDTVESW